MNPTPLRTTARAGHWRGLALCALAGLVAAHTSAADDPEPARPAANRDQAAPAQRADVRRFMDRIYDPGKYEHACTATNPAEFAAWQAKARKAYVDLLRLEVIRRDAGDFKPAVRLKPGVDDLGAFTRQEGLLETEPDVGIQFWLLKPKGPGPFPVAITANGHGPNRGSAGIYLTDAERRRTLAEDRDVGVQAAQRGFLAIVTSTRGIGKNPEAFAIADLDGRNAGKDCVAHNWHVLVAGRTMMGERVWDIMRFIDWALALPESDGKTILMTGNSGGGMLTQHAAAADERITIAIPSSSFDNYFNPSGNLTHCQCNHVPGLVRFGQFWDVAGLTAPRHLLTVTGRRDRAHPMTEVEHAAAQVKRIYRAAGAADRYDHRFGDAGHRFYKDIMWEFVSRALGRDVRKPG
jgi:hypothetical protein